MKEYKDRHNKPLADEYSCACPYFKDEGQHLSHCLVGPTKNKLEKAAATYAISSRESYDGFRAGAQYCTDIIEGQLHGYKVNGSLETQIALSNLLYYIRGRDDV